MKLYKFRKNKKGQNLIEFVMVMPVFFLILAFTINIGQILISKYALKQAVYEGARHAVVQQTRSQGVSVAKTNTKSMLKNSISTTLTSSNLSGGNSWQKGDVVCYQAVADVKLLFPWVVPGFKMSAHQPIQEKIYMMVENQALPKNIYKNW